MGMKQSFIWRRSAFVHAGIRFFPSSPVPPVETICDALTGLELGWSVPNCATTAVIKLPGRASLSYAPAGSPTFNTLLSSPSFHGGRGASPSEGGHPSDLTFLAGGGAAAAPSCT